MDPSPEVVRTRPPASRINPRYTMGRLRAGEQDVVYVVTQCGKTASAPTLRRAIVSPRWLRGWKLKAKVRVASVVHSYDFIIIGIADLATDTFEGEVPNVPLPQWLITE